MVIICKFLASKPIDLVSRQPKCAILLNHVCIEARVCHTIVVGIVLPSIDLNNDTLSAGKQKKKIHPLTRKRTW